MLKQRLLTAAVLLPLVIGAIFTLTPAVFALLTAVVILLGAWEWAALMGGRKRSVRTVYVVIMAVMLLGAEMWRQQWPQHAP